MWYRTPRKSRKIVVKEAPARTFYWKFEPIVSLDEGFGVSIWPVTKFENHNRKRPFWGSRRPFVILLGPGSYDWACCCQGWNLEWPGVPDEELARSRQVTPSFVAELVADALALDLLEPQEASETETIPKSISRLEFTEEAMADALVWHLAELKMAMGRKRRERLRQDLLHDVSVRKFPLSILLLILDYY